MPQIRVSATPLHIRADVLAKVLRIESANVVLYEWIKLVNLSETPIFSDETIFDIQKVLADTANLVELVQLAVSHTRSDAALFSDSETRSIGKVLADAAALSEAATLALAKVLADAATIGDAANRAVGKPLADASSFTDARVNHFTKVAFSEYAIDYFLEDYTQGTDYVYATDSRAFAFTKALTDTFTATVDLNGVLTDDDQTFEFSKSIDHVKTISDLIALAVGRPLANAASVSDTPSLGVGRPVSDSFTMSEASVLGFGLGASEAGNFSDALQYAGAKPLADAASVSEVAALQFSRPASDDFSISETNILALGLGPSDTATFADSGELLNQDYCEAFYFAEDYVGTSRTF